jgi:hypothetical protein
MEPTLKENQTCLVYGPNFRYESEAHGVRPLLELINSKQDLRGFSVVDKVTGKAAAYLYLILGITHVHSLLISDPALTLLEKNHVEVTYDKKISMILNHERTDDCPLEKAVANVGSNDEALLAIRKTVQILMAAKAKR